MLLLPNDISKFDPDETSIDHFLWKTVVHITRKYILYISRITCMLNDILKLFEVDKVSHLLLTNLNISTYNDL